MAIVAGDFVRVTIEGTDRTDFIVDYSRYSTLCEIGQSFTMTLSHDFPVSLSPYDSFDISEWYEGDLNLVLRGYSITIDQDFEGNFVIQGQDRSVLLFDYFIPTQILSKGESVDFWIQFYADQVGLSIDFQASSANVVVAPDTQMGLQTAGDGILTMERLAAYFIRYDSSLNKLVAFRLGSSEPVITIDDIIEGKRLLGTDKTRNVVKVYGGFRFDFDPTGPPEQLYAEARTEIPELLVDKTVVVSSPGLQKQTFLDIVADRILNTVNSIDDIHLYSLPKFVPDLEVGQVAHINVDHSPHIVYAGDRKITSIESTFKGDGAQTIIGIGEKCSRISVQFPTPPVYATTTEDGVAVSWNAGNSFIPSNAGLTGSGLMGENIGVNSYGQQMVLTAAGIFKRPSTSFSWTFVDDPSTLPDPINDSNDQPSGVAATNLELIRIVDEPTNRNVFHFMANGTSTSGNKARSWVYTTLDFGNSWGSTQLYVPANSGGFQEHPFAPSGIEYDVYGHDLFGGIDNNIFVLVTSTSEIFEEKFLPDLIYFSARTVVASNKAWAGTYDGDGWPTPSSTSHLHTAGDIIAESKIHSITEDRDVAYWVIKSVHGPSTERAWYVSVLRTDDGGDTWELLVDEVLWYTGDFTGPTGNDQNDYAGTVMFDYASTKENFNFVITASSHHAEVGEGLATFRGFFFNDNYLTDTHNHTTKSTTVQLGITSDQSIFSMNFPDSAAHSTNLTGTNYGYNALFTTENHLNEVPEFTDIDVRMSVQEYNMTTQTITEKHNVFENYVMGPSIQWATFVDGGIYCARDNTPFWFYSYRLRVSESPETYEHYQVYLEGGNIFLTQGPGSQQFTPFGIPYATGTGRAISLDGFSKTMYEGGSRVSNATQFGTGLVEHNQGSPSTSNWFLPANFKFVEQHSNMLDSDEYWTTNVSAVRAQDFAWKTFLD